MSNKNYETDLSVKECVTEAGIAIGGAAGGYVGAKAGEAVGGYIGGEMGAEVGKVTGKLVGTKVGAVVGAKCGNALGEKIEEWLESKDVALKVDAVSRMTDNGSYTDELKSSFESFCDEQKIDKKAGIAALTEWMHVATKNNFNQSRDVTPELAL